MQVCIESQAYLKLWTWIGLHKTEVGGFGVAKYNEETKGAFWVDTFLVPQTVTGSEVDFSADGLAYAVEKFGDLLDDPTFIPVSWHSHNTMNVFWSQTDEECIKTYREWGLKKLISFVGNHKREAKMRLDFFDVEHFGIKIPQVTMDDRTLFLSLSDPVYDVIFTESDEMVKKPAPKPPQSWHPNPTNATKGGKPWSIKDQTPEALKEPGQTLAEALEIRDVMNHYQCSWKDAKELLEDDASEDDGQYTFADLSGMPEGAL